jgi:hypothetical protein
MGSGIHLGREMLGGMKYTEDSVLDIATVAVKAHETCKRMAN